MTYATLDALIGRAGELEIRQVSDRERQGVIDPDVVKAALQDADSLIDGYISVRYALPLPAVPDLIKTWAVSIARYVLHRNGAPANVAQDYKDAIAALKDVSRGVLALPVPAGGPAPASMSGQVMSSHPDQVFTPGRLRGWR